MDRNRRGRWRDGGPEPLAPPAPAAEEVAPSLGEGDIRGVGVEGGGGKGFAVGEGR